MTAFLAADTHFADLKAGWHVCPRGDLLSSSADQIPHLIEVFLWTMAKFYRAQYIQVGAPNQARNQYLCCVLGQTKPQVVTWIRIIHGAMVSPPLREHDEHRRTLERLIESLPSLRGSIANECPELELADLLPRRKRFAHSNTVEVTG